MFQGDRLYRPIGYPNALAAFLMLGLWPLVMLAASPKSRPSCAAARCSARPRSRPQPSSRVARRGGVRRARRDRLLRVVADPGALAARGRDRVAPVWRGFSTLDHVQHGATASATQAAGRVIVGGAVIGLIGGIVGLRRAEDPVPVDDRPGAADRPGGRPAGGGHRWLVVAVDRDAAGFTDRKWHAFKAGQGSDAGDWSNRLLTAGSNRYDFWRVSVDMLKDRPVTGYGAANWQWRYLGDARSGEEPDNAHGAIWEFAAGLGIVGVAHVPDGAWSSRSARSSCLPRRRAPDRRRCSRRW